MIIEVFVNCSLWKNCCFIAPGTPSSTIMPGGMLGTPSSKTKVLHNASPQMSKSWSTLNNVHMKKNKNKIRQDFDGEMERSFFSTITTLYFARLFFNFLLFW